MEFSEHSPIGHEDDFRRTLLDNQVNAIVKCKVLRHFEPKQLATDDKIEPKKKHVFIIEIGWNCS